MEITGSKEDWDEEAIMALYRTYQETRDGVDFRHYRQILDAAKEQIDARYGESRLESGMANIRAEAARLFPANAAGAEQQSPLAERRHAAARPAKWKEDLKQKVSDFFESISPMKLKPVAVTLALVVAVTPFFVNPGKQIDSGIASQLASLDPYRLQAADELGRLGEFRHGFSAYNRDANASGSNRYADAFSNGVIAVDLQTVDPFTDEQQLSALISSASAFPAVSEKLPAGTDANLREQVVTINSALENHYENDGYQPVFLFGQWVESAYLLSRVAIANSNPDVMTAALENLPQLSKLLDDAGYLSTRVENDFQKLLQIREGTSLDAQSVSRASSILLKLRTLEPQVQG